MTVEERLVARWGVRPASWARCLADSLPATRANQCPSGSRRYCPSEFGTQKCLTTASRLVARAVLREVVTGRQWEETPARPNAVPLDDSSPLRGNRLCPGSAGRAPRVCPAECATDDPLGSAGMRSPSGSRPLFARHGEVDLVPPLGGISSLRIQGWRSWVESRLESFVRAQR